MIIINSISSLKKIIRNKKPGQTTGFVPTMGALHEGHLSLIRKARRENDRVVVSIFVNPAQFGPKEDLKKYPRDIKRDCRLCLKEGVDIVFNPSVKDMYPGGFDTYVEVEALSRRLCGRSRPGHFRGVTTIVLKLFNLVRPDTAYFGQKDAQQLKIIKKMVFDLNVPVVIKAMPTVRETDGLAMSSRNSYLSGAEREDALVLYRSLMSAKDMVKSGVRDARRVINAVRNMVKEHAEIDYIEIVDPETFQQARKISRKSLVLIAARVGKTRLIDNIYV